MNARGRTPWLAIAGAAVVAGAAIALVVLGRGERRPGRGALDDGRPPGSAIVEITSVPVGARVLEDGQERGVTPLALPVAPGRDVLIELRSPGYEPVRRIVNASAGEPVSIRAELMPAPAFAPPSDGGVR